MKPVAINQTPYDQKSQSFSNQIFNQGLHVQVFSKYNNITHDFINQRLPVLNPSLTTQQSPRQKQQMINNLNYNSNNYQQQPSPRQNLVRYKKQQVRYSTNPSSVRRKAEGDMTDIREEAESPRSKFNNERLRKITIDPNNTGPYHNLMDRSNMSTDIRTNHSIINTSEYNTNANVSMSGKKKKSLKHLYESMITTRDRASVNNTNNIQQDTFDTPQLFGRAIQGLHSQRDYVEGSFCLKERSQQHSPIKQYWQKAYQKGSIDQAVSSQNFNPNDSKAFNISMKPQLDEITVADGAILKQTATNQNLHQLNQSTLTQLYKLEAQRLSSSIDNSSSVHDAIKKQNLQKMLLRKKNINLMKLDRIQSKNDAMRVKTLYNFKFSLPRVSLSGHNMSKAEMILEEDKGKSQDKLKAKVKRVLDETSSNFQLNPAMLLLNQNPTTTQAHAIQDSITKLFSTSAHRPKPQVPLRTKLQSSYKFGSPRKETVPGLQIKLGKNNMDQTPQIDSSLEYWSILDKSTSIGTSNTLHNKLSKPISNNKSTDKLAHNTSFNQNPIPLESINGKRLYQLNVFIDRIDSPRKSMKQDSKEGEVEFSFKSRKSFESKSFDRDSFSNPNDFTRKTKLFLKMLNHMTNASMNPEHNIDMTEANKKQAGQSKRNQDIDEEEWIYRAGKAINMKQLRQRLNLQSKVYQEIDFFDNVNTLQGGISRAIPNFSFNQLNQESTNKIGETSRINFNIKSQSISDENCKKILIQSQSNLQDELRLLKLKIKMTDNIITQPTEMDQDVLINQYENNIKQTNFQDKDKLIQFLESNRDHFSNSLDKKQLQQYFNLKIQESNKNSENSPSKRKQLAQSLRQSPGSPGSNENEIVSTKDYLDSIRNSAEFQHNKELYLKKKTIEKVVNYIQKQGVEFATDRIPRVEYK
ncbi:UNKNOWN [Stylonychia lemnae]|uniref:Uncharacterized protein n=1 Tax=Stylonychia lemnae TaxID=5949 RepID=A0A077ZZQ1_STYLE|nr:UNKNOWN [Stylonychia lemnae]|eukprot:CDW75097.1 UNKNOWN [Stylonychia lemnae]